MKEAAFRCALLALLPAGMQLSRSWRKVGGGSVAPRAVAGRSAAAMKQPGREKASKETRLSTSTSPATWPCGEVGRGDREVMGR